MPLPRRGRSCLACLVLTLLALGWLPAGAENVSYTHDPAGRLVRVVYDDGREIELTYDANGNLVSRSAIPTAPVPVATDLKVDKAGEQLLVRYRTGLCNASDHALLIGGLGDFSRVTAAVCSIGNSGLAPVVIPAERAWFLVAGVETGVYSSLGSASTGERVVAEVPVSCPGFAQDTTRTCP